MAREHIDRFCIGCNREFTSTDALYQVCITIQYYLYIINKPFLQHTLNSIVHRDDTDEDDEDESESESEEEDEEDEEDDEDDDDNMMESLFHEYLRHLIATQANMQNGEYSTRI